MISGVNKKNQIELSDYDYKADIAQRIALSRLSQDDIILLDEIVFGPLKVAISDLGSGVEMDALARMENLGLYRIEGGYLIVDKEERRRFEIVQERYSEEGPHLGYVRSLFSKVPIGQLLNWFVIPRASSDIFMSIVEKYLSTPRHYERLILEIEFDDTRFKKVLDLLFANDGAPISFDRVKAILGVTEEELHEMVLHLEFNLLAFLVYRDGEQCIAPLAEWTDYLKRKRALLPMTTQGSIHARTKSHAVELAEALEKIDNCEGCSPQLISELLDLDFLTLMGEEVAITADGKMFLEKGRDEQALYLLRYPYLFWREGGSLGADSARRSVERSLEALKHGEWVDFGRFVESIDVPLKGHPPIELVKRGARWGYSRPIYSPEERQEVAAYIEERLGKLGLVEVGDHDGSVGIRLTPLGCKFISQ